MVGQIHRAPNRRPKNTPLNSKMAKGWSIRGRGLGENGSGDSAGSGGYSSNAKDNQASGRLRKSENPSAAAHWNRGRFAESGSSDGWLGCLGQREPPSRAA